MALALFALRGLVAAAPVASVFGGRVPCVETDGVQFCAGSVMTRVESWDRVPLDANVTLPPVGMSGPFPLIVDLHGWSLGKANGPFVERALAGYVVLSYTARGFHESCGFGMSRLPDATLTDPGACLDRGWVRLADARYEARDTQHLAGLLADEGLVIPDKVGVTGVSYGGGQSMILAALRNRVMLPDGSFVPWKSPGGLDMTVAAAAPLIPWSDLAYALTPNGRTLDYRTDNPYGLRGGVQKQSWNALLYGVGLATGFYVPPGLDPEADLTAWNDRLTAGEPYDSDPAARTILVEVASRHSAYGIDDSIAPAPLFIYNAWTDDLFPVDEALRYWRRTRQKYPAAEIALHFEDGFGHPRADLSGNVARVSARVEEFFARYLKGESGQALPAVETYTQACHGTTEEGPFTAGDWDEIHPGEVRYTSRRTQRFTSEGGSPETAAALDPLSGGPCRILPAADDPGAATYRLPAAKGDGYTLLGSPTVIAELAATSPAAQVVAQLWDVAPDGMQALVSHSVYRPRSDNAGPQVFQLHPSGWHFTAGHVVKLELLGRSTPYVRPSNGVFTVTVSRLELRLPVHEVPDGKVVKTPAPAADAPAGAEPLGCDLSPRTGCNKAAGDLAIGVGGRGDQGRLAWHAATPAADFGDPGTAGLALCVYDGGARLIAAALAPSGASCSGKTCWTASATGLRYLDRHAHTGVRAVTLRTGGTDTSLRLAGGGPRLGVPVLPVSALPLTVQLVRDAGSCWTASFAAPRRNTSRTLRASAR
jgi:predicted acyl esterase